MSEKQRYHVICVWHFTHSILSPSIWPLHHFVFPLYPSSALSLHLPLSLLIVFSYASQNGSTKTALCSKVKERDAETEGERAQIWLPCSDDYQGHSMSHCPALLRGLQLFTHRSHSELPFHWTPWVPPRRPDVPPGPPVPAWHGVTALTVELSSKKLKNEIPHVISILYKVSSAEEF